MSNRGKSRKNARCDTLLSIGRRMGINDRDYMRPNFRSGAETKERISFKDRLIFLLWRIKKIFLSR